MRRPTVTATSASGVSGNNPLLYLPFSLFSFRAAKPPEKFPPLGRLFFCEWVLAEDLLAKRPGVAVRGVSVPSL